MGYLNQLEIDTLFERLWELYPCKERPSAAKKAFTVACRKGEDHRSIEQAVRIYALETQGDEFHFHFVNFLNEEHWKDLVSVHQDLEGYLHSLEAKKEEAKGLIDAWNEACHPHWCPVLSWEDRVPLARKALANETFRKHWQKALKIAQEIFFKPLHSDDPRSKVVLSFRWFTTIKSEKHTVLRLVEREYGYPSKYEPKYVDSTLNKEEMREILDLWNNLDDETRLDI